MAVGPIAKPMWLRLQMPSEEYPGCSHRTNLLRFRHSMAARPTAKPSALYSTTRRRIKWLQGRLRKQRFCIP